MAVRGMNRRFSWDALNVTKDTECGGSKCYFPSLQGERGDEGWLIGHSRVGSLTEWSRAFAHAEELRTHFGVDHLLRGPPFLANLSREQATHLNAKIRARLDRERNPYLKVWAQYYAAGPHPVQAVRSCSWPECMVLRCQESLTDQAVDDFLANAPNKTKLSLGIKKNFAVVAAMVKAHPCLKVDFQVYLRNDGAVLNIDLDRCEIPVGDEEKLRLAQFPGLCGKHSSQLTLDKALEQLTGVSSLPVAPPQRTKPLLNWPAPRGKPLKTLRSAGRPKTLG